MPEDEKRVDPRYDPAFQRGFEGAVTSGLRSHSVQRAALVTPAPYRAPAADAAEESRAGDRQPREGQPREVELTRSAAVEEPDPAPEYVASGAGRRLSRNPFLLALILLGAGMTVGGIAWANQARMLVATRGGAATDLDYWFLQASVVAAPLTIIAGIGILAGVLFIAATAWNRRP
ncbi:MAG: hypothetical protein JWP32_1892 [Schumannella sp.]|jgi:hypothetical protein|nr:hypothetical protein [Schumannella sp.]